MESELMELFNAALKRFGETNSICVTYPFFDEIDDSGEPVRPTGDHLRVSYLPTTPESIHVDDGSGFRRWVVQVDAVFDRGNGQFGASRMAEKLAAAFPFLHEFKGKDHRYRVEELPAMSPPVLDGKAFFIPVSFELATFTRG